MQAQQPIADVDRLASGEHVTEAGEEVGVLKTRFDVEFGSDRPDHFHVVIEWVARVAEYICPRLQGPVVFRAGVQAQTSAAYSRCWIGRVVAVAVGFGLSGHHRGETTA